jgi:NitT/TauT family transport system substrate-binding protein
VLLRTPRRHETARRPVTIAQVGDSFLYAPIYIALDNGHFAREGFDVNITSTGGDDKTWAAVMSGGAQFGVADPTFVVISGQRGQPGKVVASIVNGVPFWGITFNKDIPQIRSGKDLANYTVATFPSPSTAYTLQAKMFRDAGLEPRIREGGLGALIPMLHAKQADIALELEPNVSQAVSEGARVLYSLGDVYGDFAITGLTVKPSTIQDDPSLVTGVTLAIERALADLHTRPAECMRHLARRFPEIKPGVADSALKRALEANVIPKHVLITKEAWDRAVQVRRDAGDITATATYEDFVDVAFATNAMKATGGK